MARFGRRETSSIVGALGVLAAVVAVVGTQYLGWEWGSGQALPTAVGILAAAVAVAVSLRRR